MNRIPARTVLSAALAALLAPATTQAHYASVALSAELVEGGQLLMMRLAR